jgi:hypothetical protein
MVDFVVLVTLLAALAALPVELDAVRVVPVPLVVFVAIPLTS